MIRESIPFMTIIDVFIIVFSLISIWLIYKNKKRLVHASAFNGSMLIVFCLSLMGLFYLVDLFALHGLSDFTTHDFAKDALENFHLNYNWIITQLLVVTLFLGFFLVQKKVFSLIGRLEESDQINLQHLTDQTRLAEELQRIKERFQLAIAGSQDGFWDWPDVSKDEQWWSARFYGLLGYGDQEIKASYPKFIELVHPEDKALVQAVGEDHFKGKAPYDVEARLRTKTGKHFWFRFRGSALFDAAGEPVRMSGSIQNIHDDKLFEEQTLIKNRQLDAMVWLGEKALAGDALENLVKETINVAQINLDADFVALLQFLPEEEAFLLQAGQGWKNGLTGNLRIPNDPKNLFGFSYISKVPVRVDDFKMESRHFSLPPLLLENKVNSCLSVAIPGEDAPYGVLTVHNRSANSFTEDDGLFLQSLANILAQAIAREKTQMRLKESDQIFNSFLNNTSQNIYLKDLEGKYFLVNKKFEETYGLSSKQILGKNDLELFPPDYAEESVESDREVLGTKSPVEREVTNPDGTRTHLCIKFPLFDASGRLYGIGGASADITERKKAAQLALRLSRIVRDSSNEIYIFLQDSLKFVQVNQGAISNLGYSEDELTRMTPMDLKPEYSPERFKSLVAPLESGEEEFILFETVHKRKNGTLYPVEVRLQLFKDETPPVFMAVIQDITERRESEEEIRKLSSAVGQAPLSIIITNTKGTINYANPHAEKTTGYSAGELVGENANVLKSGETPPGEYKKLWDTITSGRQWEGVFHNKKKNGELYWESALISPIKDREGVISGFLALKTDISATKEMEKTLLRKDVLMDSMMNSIQEGVIAINEKSEIQLFNRAAEEIFGYSCPEIMGRNITILIPEPNREKHLRGVARYLQTGKLSIIGKTFEASGLHKDGTWFPMEVTITEMVEDGTRLFIGVCRDVTDRKLAQADLERVHRTSMESEKLAGIGELAAGACHEVLNPLNIISTSVQMLQRKRKDDEALQTFCAKTRNEIRRIEKIMGSLLTFSRKGDSELQEVSLEDMLTETAALTQKDFALDNIEIVKECSPGTPNIWLDKDKIRQVLLNISNNARHAMPEGGTLTYACEPLQKDGRPWVRVRISDTGEGMSPETMKKIFEPFFTTKPEGKGTGVGMSVAHGIVRDHGGVLHAESKLGKGTSFFIDLPVDGGDAGGSV